MNNQRLLVRSDVRKCKYCGSYDAGDKEVHAWVIAHHHGRIQLVRFPLRPFT